MAGIFSPKLVLRTSYRIAKHMITEPKSVICLHERYNFEVDSASGVEVVVVPEHEFEVVADSNDDFELGSVIGDFKNSVEVVAFSPL